MLRPSSVVKSIVLIAWFLFLVVAVASPTTRVGPLGAVKDLRFLLPIDVAKVAPQDQDATQYKTTLKIGQSRAVVTVFWYCFQLGESRYILSYGANLDKLAAGYQILFPTSNDPINVGDEKRVLEQIGLNIVWLNNTVSRKRFGTDLINIWADGTSKIL